MCLQKIKSFFTINKQPVKRSLTESMDLQTFISQSLINIMNGIHNAQVHFGKNSTIDDKNFKPLIAPTHVHGKELNYARIDFDIAVTAANNSIDVFKANAGLNCLEINNASNQEKQESTMNKIKFSIHIQYPSTPNNLFSE